MQGELQQACRRAIPQGGDYEKLVTEEHMTKRLETATGSIASKLGFAFMELPNAE